MNTQTVVVIHRLTMVAEGIAAALSRYPWIIPVATATSAAEAERAGVRADAVALDPEAPGADVLARRLTGQGVRVVRLGGDDGEGIRVPLGAPIASLVSALAPGHRLDPPASYLTDREREILGLVAQGLAGKQVARQLGISAKTVEKHKTSIYSKLRVPNQVAAVRLAMSDGLLPQANGAILGTR